MMYFYGISINVLIIIIIEGLSLLQSIPPINVLPIAIIIVNFNQRVGWLLAGAA